jgi:hypothetical protein
MACFMDNGNLDEDDPSSNTFDSFDSTRLALKMFFTVSNNSRYTSMEGSDTSIHR